MAVKYLRMKTIDTISHVLRLKPGEDLKYSIQQYIHEHNIEAGWVVTSVGSLTEYKIRFANLKESSCKTGYFEIIALSGTLSKEGVHLHISVSDSEGVMTGGHLLEGCKVYTTAEIIIAESLTYIFSRTEDSMTGYKELQVKDKQKLSPDNL
jgi:uncharacterized protein